MCKECRCEDGECDEAADEDGPIAIASLGISECEYAKKNSDAEQADPNNRR